MAFSHHNSLTPVPPLGTPFNTISCFSDQMAYLPNAPQCSRWIHQRGCSSLRSPSSTILLRSSIVDLTFIFTFIFIFLFLEQLRLGSISHAVTSVTSWWHSHKTDHGTQENGVEGSRIKWYHTTWTTHVDLMSYTWLFRVGCTAVSMDHE